MKNIILLFLFVGALNVNAQPPQVINYQGVARDSVGHPLVNQNVGIRLSILDSSTTGQTVYIETHQVLTNNSGLFNLSIGGGVIVSGSFSAISWGQNNKWLMVEMDVDGGSNYQLLGTTQFLSVPYALHSGSSDNEWNLKGNSGTNSSNNFVGTIDNIPLIFKVNNQKSGSIDLTKSNTSLGYQTLYSNTTGINNTALGFQALLNNTSGVHNTANGDGALYSNTSGNYNTANGLSALYSNTIGSNNTANGETALYSNTTGNDNTANGLYALYFNTTAIQNTAIGVHALYSNTTGSSNTASGVATLNFNTTGTWNTAIGYLGLYSNTTGSSNTANGTSALNDNTTGNNNVATGFGALRSNTTGINNTAIGSNADVTFDTLTNATAIGYNAKVSESNSLVLGSTGGDAINVGIGTASPHSRLHVLNGDIYVDSIAQGLILKSPNGNCWRITIDNSGNLIRTAITCP